MSRTHRRKPYHFYNADIPKWYKRITKRIRRAKSKRALRSNYNVMPKFKREDNYYW